MARVNLICPLCHSINLVTTETIRYKPLSKTFRCLNCGCKFELDYWRYIKDKINYCEVSRYELKKVLDRQYKLAWDKIDAVKLLKNTPSRRKNG